MGKTTRFHPVSLPILRESARVCSYRFGRIHQDKISADQMSAKYTVEILAAPIEFGGALPQQIQAALNTCYSSDVWVTRCWFTKSEKIMVEMMTTIDPLNASRAAEHWLDERTPEQTQAAQFAIVDESEAFETDWLDDAFGPTGEEI